MLPDALVFFTDESNKKQRCKILADEYDEAFTWEQSTVSEYSPCIVESVELVARQIFSPIHVDEKNKIKTAAFDDISNKGLSLNRIGHTSEDAIHARGENKAERDRMNKPDREYLGFSRAYVFNVRDYNEEGKRVFAVFDTGLEDSPDHCDLFLLLFGASPCGTLSPKAAKKHRRLELQKMFGDLINP